MKDYLTDEEMFGTLDEFERDYQEDLENGNIDGPYIAECITNNGSVIDEYITYDRDKINDIVEKWEQDLSLSLDEFTIKIYNGDTLELKISVEVKEK